MKIKKHIEIVRTNILSMSSMRAESALRMQAELSKHYETVGISEVNDFIDLELVVRKSPDLVILGLKRMTIGKVGTPSYSEVWMGDYFDKHSIRYTGSKSAAIRLDYNKAQSKAIVEEAGIPTPKYFTAVPDQYKSAAELPLAFPLFIKPVSTGGGSGVGDDSVVRTFAQFKAKVAAIETEFATQSLVESYLEGREFTVALIDTYLLNEPMVMPVEIIADANKKGDRILGARVKTEDKEAVIGINNKFVKEEVCRIAASAYQLLGGRDFGRIDIRMDADGVAYFLEANFAPAIGTRYFAGAAKITKDLDYETILLKIVGLGLQHEVKDTATTSTTTSLPADTPVLL